MKEISRINAEQTLKEIQVVSVPSMEKSDQMSVIEGYQRIAEDIYDLDSYDPDAKEKLTKLLGRKKRK